MSELGSYSNVHEGHLAATGTWWMFESRRDSKCRERASGLPRRVGARHGIAEAAREVCTSPTIAYARLGSNLRVDRGGQWRRVAVDCGRVVEGKESPVILPVYMCPMS